MPASRLTDAAIRALKPKAAHYDVSDGRGLALRVHPSGRKVWLLRATNGRTGERIRRELGQYDLDPRNKAALGLPAARDKAAAWRAAIATGTDPARPVGEMTVRVALDQWLQDAELRSKAQVRRRFELHVLPALGNRLLADIEQKDVSRLLRTLRHNRGMTAECNRVRASLSALFRWAVAAGEVSGNPVLATARVTEPSAQRERAGETRLLTVDELSALWRVAEADVSPVVSSLLRLLILLPLRRQEWTELRWDEIERNGEGWVLRLSAHRMKGKRSHAVPLSVGAVAILHALPKRGDYVFSLDGIKPFAGWRTAADRLRRAAGLAATWTVHDIRRGVATAMGEAGIRETIIRRILAHSPRSLLGVTAVYEKSERLDELRIALEQWATTLTAKLAGEAEVVAMRRERA
jgi:site-specific recombinase XerD